MVADHSRVGEGPAFSSGLSMPRTARASVADVCYHVLSRGNARQTVFHDARDFDEFTTLIAQASARHPVDTLAWCLMPNHFHFVLRPRMDDALSRWMQWLLTSHVRRYQRRYSSTGRVWQGRYKAFPIQKDDHLLAVLRYVERNPVRASLAASSMQWKWSSAGHRDAAAGTPEISGRVLSTSPVELPTPWTRWVDSPLHDSELSRIRECAARDRPYGTHAWILGTAERLGLQSSLRGRGRPPRRM